jgi:hypothetical protein
MRLKGNGTRNRIANPDITVIEHRMFKLTARIISLRLDLGEVQTALSSFGGGSTQRSLASENSSPICGSSLERSYRVVSDGSIGSPFVADVSTKLRPAAAKASGQDAEESKLRTTSSSFGVPAITVRATRLNRVSAMRLGRISNRMIVFSEPRVSSYSFRQPSTRAMALPIFQPSAWACAR